MSAKWKGATELKLMKPEWDYSDDKVVCVLRYVGPYTTCLSSRPANDSAVAGYTEEGLRVARTSVREIEEGTGAGELKVTLEAASDQSSEAGFGAIGEPIYELEWAELELPLERHPKCGTLKADRPAGDDEKKRTWDDWADFTDADYDGTGGGKWSLATYKALKEAGHETYNVAMPIARSTTYYRRNPSGVGAGMYTKINPPGKCQAPSTGWQYLKTADRMVREGRLRTRVQEWTGAPEWNSDIYD